MAVVVVVAVVALVAVVTVVAGAKGGTHHGRHLQTGRNHYLYISAVSVAAYIHTYSGRMWLWLLWQLWQEQEEEPTMGDIFKLVGII